MKSAERESAQVSGAERFLRDDDFSLASDLARAAVALGWDVENGAFKPEHESFYRALVMRLHEHTLAALRTQEAGGWRPTEEPPEAGVVVLVYSPDAEDRLALFVAEYDPECPGPDGDGAWIDPLSCDTIDAWPTHWMPLPAPPQEERP